MDFEPLRADFLRLTTEILYCTVMTVAARIRPAGVICPDTGSAEQFAVGDFTPRTWRRDD